MDGSVELFGDISLLSAHGTVSMWVQKEAGTGRLMQGRGFCLYLFTAKLGSGQVLLLLEVVVVIVVDINYVFYMKLHPRTLNGKYKNFLFFADWYLGTSLEFTFW